MTGLPTAIELLNFLATLRAQGISVTPVDAHRIERILSSLAKTAVPEDAASALPIVLTPVLAKSPAQQVMLQAELLRWTEERRRSAADKSASTVIPVSSPIGGKTSKLRLLLAGVVITTAVLAAWVFLQWQSDKPVRGQPTKVGPAIAALGNGQQSSLPELMAEFALGVLLGLSALWILVREVSRQRNLHIRRANAVERDVLDRGAAPFGSWLYEDVKIKSLVQRFRDWVPQRIDMIDEARTIEETIRSGGQFSLVLKPIRRQSAWGIILEEESRHDHMTRLGENLVHALRKENVRMALSYCSGALFDSGDLDRSYRRAEMAAIKDMPESRLLMIGDGRALMSPLGDEPDPVVARETSGWGAKILLSTRPIEAWDTREISLMRDGWNLATARVSGLAALARHLPEVAEGGKQLEGRRSIPQPLRADGFAAARGLVREIQKLQETAASDQVAAELEDISRLVPTDPATSIARLLALRDQSLIAINAEQMLALRAADVPGARPKDSAERLEELRQNYRALKALSASEYDELVGAILAYRTMSKLASYMINRPALSVFDRRLAERGARAPVADIALAVIAGALAAGRIDDVLEGVLGIPITEVRERVPDIAMMADGSVFAGRTALREFTNQLPQRLSTRILLCLGGAGAGKSATGAYLAQTSRRTELFNFVAISTQEHGVLEAEQRLKMAADVASVTSQVVSVLLDKRAHEEWASDRVTLIFVDDLDQLSAQGREQLARLMASACEYPSDLRLCITGPSQTFPDRLLLPSAVEKYAALEYLSLGSAVLDPESAIVEAWLAAKKLRPA